MAAKGIRGEVVPADRIEHSIVVVRGQRVMLDSVLAQVYGVLTERLNEQVRRNADRFPADFAFRLTAEEASALLPQIAGAKPGRGGRTTRPWVFTEHGAVMAAHVLKSPVAARASIQVVRAFVRLRELLSSRADLAERLAELESRMVRHDRQFAVVFDAIRKLTALPRPDHNKPPVGF